MRLCMSRLCALWLMWFIFTKADEPKIFCYYPSSPVARVGFERLDPWQIDPSLCTHLIYGFVCTTENGDVSVVDPQNDLTENGGKAGFQKFNAMRKRNEKLKTLISINDQGSVNSMKVMADTSLRSKYAKNVVNFVLRHGFDGVDSFGASLAVFGDARNYVLFLNELRTILDGNDLILSVHVEGTEVDARWFNDIPEIAKYAHFVLLTVECHKSTDSNTGHMAPLYPASREKSNLDLALNINASVHYWLDQGVPAEKLILGTRLYGNGFVLKNSAKYAPGSPASGEATFNSTLGHVGYKDICKMISRDPWTSVWDEEQRVPYSYAEDRWISYENVRSLTEKGKFAKTLGLGGVMAWTIDQDDHRGDCGGRYPLLNALNCGLRDIGCSISPAKDSSVGGRIVCFYENRAIEVSGYRKLDPSKIDTNLCTHLIYLDVDITEDAEVKIIRPWLDLPDNRGSAGYQKVNALRKKNEKLKTLLSSTGGSQATLTYSKVAADPSLRSKYVKNVVDFLLCHDFNGFDIFWQFPNLNGSRPEDVGNFVLLLKELRAGFDDHDLILSVRVTAVEALAVRYYDIPEISKHVDFILLLPQFHRSSDRVTAHWTPLYPASRQTSTVDQTLNVHASVDYWLNQGAPAEKLILATRFYGTGYVLNNSADHSPGSPAIVAIGRTGDVSIINYSEICRLTSQDTWTTVWDEEQRVPYIYSGNTWISYDNVRSLTEKGKYVRARGLGGVMTYSIDQDDHRGDCGERNPLLNALNCGLRGIRCTSALTPDVDPDEYARRTCARFDLKYVRHPENCAQFWICMKIRENQFKAEPFHCGGGLHFDTSKNICRSKERVQCS